LHRADKSERPAGLKVTETDEPVSICVGGPQIHGSVQTRERPALAGSQGPAPLSLSPVSPPCSVAPTSFLSSREWPAYLFLAALSSFPASWEKTLLDPFSSLAFFFL